MKKEDLSNLNVDELIQKKLSLMQELHKLNYQRKSGRVDKPHLFSKFKKDIARIKTQITHLSAEQVGITPISESK